MLQRKTLERINAARSLYSQYGAMTVRQIYYRLLGTHGLNYKQVCYICKVGREEGLIPYAWIVDRSRPTYGKTLYETITEFLGGAADDFHLDYWVDSETRPEIWTEKDALSQVLYSVAREYNVDVKVTRGFLSISNKHRWVADTILYFGDFDPSGLYIDEDLRYEVSYDHFERVALTMDQIQEYNLPKVKVKNDDPRTPAYRAQYGNYGWELDALPPDVLKNLVRQAIETYLDFDLQHKQEEERTICAALEEMLEELI